MLSGWSLDTDVERDWLYVQATRIPGQGSDDTLFTDALMAIANQRNKFRLILELGNGLMLTSLLAGQLVILHKRVHLKGGSLRLCGMSNFNRDVLRLMGVLDRFHTYADRPAAGRD
jgi:anti-anti-sigma regulatory factor